MKRLLMIIFGVFVMFSCSRREEQSVLLTIKNNLAIDRTEMVSIAHSAYDSLIKKSSHQVRVIDLQSNAAVVSQLVDNDSDGNNDELIFQSSFKPNETKRFKIVVSEGSKEETPSKNVTYGRFVPERIDDFAWENDLVAFRTYGPEAQRLVDANEKGGTLSSGIDCWLKRVDYPIIDKWYKKYVDGGTYHKDDGEGYDPYHVGASRGCGGIGIWKNDSLYVSKNFVTHKIIANGPLRTIFELTYAPWKVDSIAIEESKRISIDLGSQMSRVEVILNYTNKLPNVTIGITQHDKKGEVKMDTLKGLYRYWETIDDSELGTGVVTDPANVQRSIDYRTNKKDLSHIYIVRKPEKQHVYYTGFAWKKAGKINSPQQWDEYLIHFAKRLSSPLEVVFEKK
jgi:hypothetical protein